MKKDHTCIGYIYGELDDDGNITYVGKSFYPLSRCRSKNVKRFVILDMYLDVEQQWIHQLKEDGINLTNKELISCREEWNVGDVHEIKSRLGESQHNLPVDRSKIDVSRKRIIHIATNIEYPSMAAAQRAYPEMSTVMIKYNATHHQTLFKFDSPHVNNGGEVI